ncbi:MAG: hypothetical protein D6681_00025, partial [Calditrichaeota bacterium]
EDKYPDVLQNLEFAIVQFYRERYPELTDYGVMRVLEALIDRYSKEQVHKPPRNFNLSSEEEELYQLLSDISEWRLGRASLTVNGLEDFPKEALGIGEKTSIPLEDLILCLKRLLKSVHKWNKSGGRRGYLTFISNFMEGGF